MNVIDRPDIADRFASARAMVAAWRPREPVYCLYPHVLEGTAQQFIEGFPGTALYAVKANPDPAILHLLWDAGVRHFDTASIAEIALVHEHCPRGKCYFMAPVKLEGAAGEAYTEYGVRHFVLDHRSELANMLAQIDGRDITVFVRLGVSDPDATYDLSTKFGASETNTMDLLRAVEESGAEPALAFNVGSLLLSPSAYASAIETCADLLDRAGTPVRLLDVGGGFPVPYPGLDVPPLEEFFAAIRRASRRLPQASEVQILAEPGRALIAEGFSVVTQVLLRKDDWLYLNDGVWGSFIETILCKGKFRHPTRVYRADAILEGDPRNFTLFGPTCDSMDRFPARFPLPDTIRAGDWIEFGMMGAYSLSNRTAFNGFYPDTMVTIDGPGAQPPGA